MKRKKLAVIIFTSVLMVGTFYLYSYERLYRNINSVSIIANKYIDDESSEEKNNIQKLRDEYQNSDIKAIIRLKNTGFEKILVQSSDNDYYLRKNLKKTYDIMGTPFIDYRSDIESSRKTIIYGHNGSSNTAPFKYLENYYDKNFYNEHQIIEIETEKGIKHYQVFSVYVETKDFTYYNKFKFSSNADFLKHITNLKNKSFYDIGVDINENDNILIIQTCSKLAKYKKYDKKYLLIISKEVK